MTLTQVAPMSQRVLMLMYTPITPAGRPAMVARAVKEAIAPPGTPGVPMESSTFASKIMVMREMLMWIPQALAKNMIINDIKMDTASMLIGNAKIFFHAGFTDWYRRRTGAGTKGI